MPMVEPLTTHETGGKVGGSGRPEVPMTPVCWITTPGDRPTGCCALAGTSVNAARPATIPSTTPHATSRRFQDLCILMLLSLNGGRR
jgi:hypothetical protein